MKKFALHLPVIVLISLAINLPLPCSGSSFLETFRDETAVLPNNEIRAAWVVRHALNSREEIDRAVDFATLARFHMLFVQVRGRGDAYYRSDLEPPGPRLEALTESFDPLAYFLERCHAADIAVHAWVNVCYVWSNGTSSPPPGHIVRTHPEWLMADRNGTRMDELPVTAWQGLGLEGYYVSPGHPEVRRHTIDVIEDIVTRYPVDGVHLDYIRYPGAGFDFSKTDRTLFALRYGVDPLLLESRDDELYQWVGTDGVQLLDSLRAEWRVAQIDSIVIGIRSAIGDLPLSAAVIPEFVSARIEKGQDWTRWVRERHVDFVVPMAYAHEPAVLGPRIEKISRSIGRERFLVGLPVFDGREQYLGYSVSILRRQGVIGFSLFSYNALAEARFSTQFLERVFFGSLTTEVSEDSIDVDDSYGE